MPSIRNVFQQSLIYGVGTLLNKLLGIIMIPIYTYHIATSEYGVLELLSQTTDVMSIFFGLGISQSVMRYYHQYEKSNESGKVVSSGVLLMAITSLVALLLLSLFSAQFSSVVTGTEEYQRLFLIMFTSMAIGMNTNIPFVVLRLRNEAMHFVIFSFVRLVIALLLNIVFVVGLQMGLFGIVLSTFLVSIVGVVYLGAYLIRTTQFSIDRKIFRELLWYGFPLVGNWLGLFALHFADRFLLQKFASLSDVGLYALAYKFGMLPSVLLIEPFMRVWDPKRFELLYSEGANELYSRVFTYFCILLCFVGLGISLCSREVIIVLSEKSYEGAHVFVPVIVLAYFFYGLYDFNQFGLLAAKKTKLLAGITILSAMFNISINILLIPQMGVWGAAVSTALSLLLFSAMTTYFSQKEFYVRYDVIRVAKCAVVAIGIFALGQTISLENLYFSFFAKTVLTFTYPIILRTLGLLSHDDFLAAWAVLPKFPSRSS